MVYTIVLLDQHDCNTSVKVTEASNRRRSEKLIQPGETLPRYDRAVSRRKQL